MNKEVKKAIKTLKTFLGMETKLEDMPLADGMTTIQADMFEPGENVFIVVTDAEPVPLPVGEYELADGKILVVKVEGIIDSIVEALPAEENPAEAETEVPVEAEKTPEQAKVKKIVRSQVEEQHFSALEEKIAELEAKIVELSKVTDSVVELAEEPKPIQFNPENSKTIEHIDLTPGKARSIRDNILETIYK